MSGQWVPGDVAWIRVGTGDWEIGLFQDDRTWACAHSRPRKEHEDVQVSRHLVVIDPESAVETNRLALAYESMRDMQFALRSLITPPRPEVFEHLVTQEAHHDDRVVITSLCGKEWTPSDRSRVKVLGKCRDCEQAVLAGWVA